MSTSPAFLLVFAAAFAASAALAAHSEDDEYGGAFLVSPGAAANIRISEAEKAEAAEHLGRLNIPGESRDALIALLSSATSGKYLPPGVTLIDGNYEALCAKVVSRLFWTAFGNEDDLSAARGVSGDAWNMARNVTLFGGLVFPWNENSSAFLRTGDIIGIYYKYSIYNVLEKHKDYTHLALVIDNVPGRGPLVAHWWNIPDQFIPDNTEPPWFFRLEFLNDLLEGFPGFFIPREIIRPKNVFTGE
jgi:hypothetical protein